MHLPLRHRQVDHPVLRIRSGRVERLDDVVAGEEPLEIRLLWEAEGRAERRSVAITMRTPGDDFDLACGFLFTEGIIRGHHDVLDISYCRDEDEEQAFNIVTVTLAAGLAPDISPLERNFYTTSSCGICGKASLEALEVQGCRAVEGSFAITAEALGTVPGALRSAQDVFERTGGLHAAGLFTSMGELVAVKEDVGRHNAVDKLIGSRVRAGEGDLGRFGLFLSGRASFELVQKALVARIPFVAAVGAPSSLAVNAAAAFNITLAGFVRENGCNIYTAQERIRL